MNCEQTRRLLDAYLDGELDLVRNLSVERHIKGCNDCSILYRNRQRLRDAISQEALYYAPPADLARRIQRSLRESDKSLAQSLTENLFSQRWLLAAAVLIVALISVAVLSRRSA